MSSLSDLAGTEAHVGNELRDSHTHHHLRETNFLDRGGLSNPGHAMRVSVSGKPVAIEAPEYVRLEPAPAAAGSPSATILRIEATALRHDNLSIVVTGDVLPNPMATGVDVPVPGNPYPKVTIETSKGSHAYTVVEKPPPGTRVAIKPGAGFFTNAGASEGARRRRGWGAPPGSFFALGNSGQVLFVVPSHKLVIVSLGFSLDDANRAPVEAVVRLAAKTIAVLDKRRTTLDP